MILTSAVSSSVSKQIIRGGKRFKISGFKANNDLALFRGIFSGSCMTLESLHKMYIAM